MINDTDARKVFKFLDYNDARVVSKHQIRLLIMYQKYVNEESAQNEAIRRLTKMLLVPELKVFDENLFAFFFTKKYPNKALQEYQPSLGSRMMKLPKVSAANIDEPSVAT